VGAVDPADRQVRLATDADADAVGRMLHDFNTEYHDITPGPERLAARMRQLMAGGEMVVVVGGPGPDGLAVLRFRESIFTDGLECYLAELYVKPDLRGRGLGRAILEKAIDVARERGADYMELGTEEEDRAARALYESMGFTNRTPWPDGQLSYFYELEL
jgi:ribosomal protein S18 acetylase RimI-like enzyme